MTDLAGLAQALDGAATSEGETLGALARRAPLVVVFLRHLG